MSARLFSGEKYSRVILDSFPSPVLIVDSNLQIYDVNRVATELVGEQQDILMRRLCGELLHCIHASQSKGGCGTTEHCQDCVLRQTAEAVTEGASRFRQLSEMQIEKNGEVRKTWLLISGSLFEYEEQKLVLVTLEDITELIELRTMLPICSHCRKVRNDKNYWQNVEDYLEKHTDIQFSHGICPECLKKHYSDIGY